MEWYYVKDGEQQGPVNEGEFEKLMSAGTITGNMLVWRAGMEHWRPCAETPDTPGHSGGTAARSKVCAECGAAFPAEEMIRYSNQWVCAGCKPIFFQRIREGAPLPSNLVYGGFWIRGVAALVDYLIKIFIGAVLRGIAMLPLALIWPGSNTYTVIYFFSVAVPVFSGAAYDTWFVGRYGATPGKMAFGLYIVQSNGARMTYWRAFGRHFARFISMFTLLIGFIMAAFDGEKRALHDRICDTRVIRKKR